MQPQGLSGDSTTAGKVGILGGGQLGCMLADAALALGLDPILFAEAASPAAALFPSRTCIGRIAEANALQAFLSQARVVVFENEFVDCDALERAAAGLAIRFAPSLNVIRELQDKLSQKELLTRLGLPTSPFCSIQPGAGEAGLAQWVEDAFQAFKGEVVFKWSRLGYDGKGVCLADNSATGQKDAFEFCRAALARSIAVYAERKVAFKRELAVVVSRSRGNLAQSFVAYPLVVSEQERGICKRVLGPAVALGAGADLESQAQSAARALGDELEIEGTFALELFESAQGELLINEIAPRVHNTGHYSQDGCQVSQFENHWRAVLDQPVNPEPSAAFGMLNLLGPDDVTLTLPLGQNSLPFSLSTPSVKLHWYAKSEIRPGRKVGHLNATAPSSNQLPRLIEALDRCHTEWVVELKKLQKKGTPAS
jgi:5-(carboxyamino)imidazole ribonucleotide synthase